MQRERLVSNVVCDRRRASDASMAYSFALPSFLVPAACARENSPSSPSRKGRGQLTKTDFSSVLEPFGEFSGFRGLAGFAVQLGGE